MANSCGIDGCYLTEYHSHEDATSWRYLANPPYNLVEDLRAQLLSERTRREKAEARVAELEELAAPVWPSDPKEPKDDDN